jgi:heme oxygenase
MNCTNLPVMEVKYATLSAESKSVMTGKTYQREKGGLSKGQHTKKPAKRQKGMQISSQVGLKKKQSIL